MATTLPPLRVRLRFPLGVYHAQSASSFGEPEWPPSPLRLLGALLSAAHEGPADEPEADRRVLQALATAPPPTIRAARMASASAEQGEDEVAPLRGVSRWAPRNPSVGELNKNGLSPRNVGRDRAEVHKGGVAIGEGAVDLVWREHELDEGQVRRLRRLAEEVTFLGTSRSPVLVEVADGAEDAASAPPVDATPVWSPVSDGVAAEAAVRVPDTNTIAAFDQRHDQRRSRTAGRTEPAGFVANLRIGQEVGYATGRTVATTFDPEWWGDMLVMAVDRETSDRIPKAVAAYAVARATRQALLASYGDVGTPEEAPAVLRGRGADPHAAVVALPFVGGEHADGTVVGVALLLPHPARLPDVADQRPRVEAGLRRLVLGSGGQGDDRVGIGLPGGATLVLRPADPRAARTALREGRYADSARTWVSVTPAIPSRWRTNRSADALLRQVTADCTDVGLPAPRSVERLRDPAPSGSPGRLLPASRLPEAWRGLVDRPAHHLRLVFDQPVRGPILLGRARHFGVGLFLPEHQDGA